MSPRLELNVGPIVDKAIRNELDRRGPELDVLGEVWRERRRQDEKWGEQNHLDGTGDDVRLLGDIDLPTYGTLAYRAKALVDSLAAKGRSQYAPILLEEVFEALSALSEDELRTELIQVAAVCVQWVQAIDRRGGAESESNRALAKLREALSDDSRLAHDIRDGRLPLRQPQSGDRP